MNAKRQTIPIILENADYAIYEAYTIAGITADSAQEIVWHLEAPDGPTADTIMEKLNKILPDWGGFDDFGIYVVPSEGQCWTLGVHTIDFTFDYKTIVEFSRKLFGICKQYGAEYQFWTIDK